MNRYGWHGAAGERTVRPGRPGRLLVLLALAALLLVAAGCGGGASSGEGGGTGGEGQTSGGTAPPADEGTGGEEAGAPREPVNLTWAYPAVPNLGYLPTLLAWQELRGEGYNVEPTFLSKAELAGQALITGDAQMAFAAPAVAAKAIQEGADIVIVAAQQRNQWTMAGRSDIASPEDLAGKRIATHSEVSITSTLIQWAAQRYGFAGNFQQLIIPGSAARMQALIAGQIDASPLLLTDTVQLRRDQGDTFRSVINFGKELPELPDNIIAVNRSWASENRETVEAVLAGLMRTYQRVNEERDWAKGQAPAYFGGMDQEFVPVAIDAYIDEGIWDPTLMLDEEIASGVLDFLFEYKMLEGDRAAADVNQYFDLSYLENARAAAGL